MTEHTYACDDHSRASQVAITPLREIQIEDVGRGAVVFDAWLREVSASFATLERISGVAGSVPMAGNIIALVDALGMLSRWRAATYLSPLIARASGST